LVRSVIRLWVFWLCLVPLAMAEKQPTEAELKALNAELIKLQKWLKNISKEKSDLQELLQQTEVGIGQNLRRIEDLKAELDALKKQIAELNQEQAKLRRKMNQQKQDIARILVASYKQGQQNNLKLLLNQSNPVELRRMLNYAQWLSQEHQETLAGYQSLLQQLVDNEQTLVDQSAKLDARNLELTKTNQSLKKTQNERKQLIAKLNKQLASGAQKLETLKTNRAKLKALLDKVTESIADIIPVDLNVAFGKLKGKLNWPVKGKVGHRFGDRVGRGALRWEGILVKSGQGASVTAVHHGRVIFADWLKGFGLLVILDHGDGYMSLYGRNEVLLRSVGEWVNAGDLIARSGDSGLEEQGLYFEIRHRGKPLNPLKWLARK